MVSCLTCAPAGHDLFRRALLNATADEVRTALKRLIGRPGKKAVRVELNRRLVQIES